MCMQDILIYGGIAINIVGALYLMACGMKYAYIFRQLKNQSALSKSIKPRWAKKRQIGWGLMIIGIIIALIGCVI